MNIHRIVIAGGGTAGWLSALYMQKTFPESNITVIESTEIGIIGAGEGTTPMINKTIDYLDIDLKDFISNTKSTIKNGVNFKNWNKDGTDYLHPFLEPNEELIENARLMYIANNMANKEGCLSTMLMEEKKVPIYFENGVYKRYGPAAIHFDARALALFLKDKAIERGITHVDSKIVDVVLKDKIVEKLILENGQEAKCNFVVDCTGFKRLIIGDYLKSNFISYKDQIPGNAAQAFFIKIDDPKELSPWTESTAEDHGWSWKIPLQHRYGCGYVYDSRVISNEDVKLEINKRYGDVEFVKQFSFEPGCLEEIWIGNCIAIGLSAGFIEPLEATSLQQTITLLDTVIKKNKDINPTEEYKQKVNKTFAKESEEIKDFVYLHYLTNREDSFWKNFMQNYRPSESFLKVLNQINNFETIHFPRECNIEYCIFDHFRYHLVANGNGITDKNNIIDYYNKDLKFYKKDLDINIKKIKEVVPKLENHYDFLKKMGGFNE